MSCTIALRGLRLAVSIGWEDAERAAAQMVRFDVEIELPGVPDAVRTDRLDQTIDYAAVSARIEHLAATTSFRLLERLAGAVDEAIRDLIPDGSTVSIAVTKERPPIPSLEGGATVTLRHRIGG